MCVYVHLRVYTYVSETVQILWGVMKAYLVTSIALSSAFSPDDLSGSESTGEKIELNEDDIKSQEVRTGFLIDFLQNGIQMCPVPLHEFFISTSQPVLVQ